MFLKDWFVKLRGKGTPLTIGTRVYIPDGIGTGTITSGGICVKMDKPIPHRHTNDRTRSFNLDRTGKWKILKGMNE